jgi:hypothetical protein
MEAISRGCRCKDLSKHHCNGTVHRVRPQMILYCTCKCHDNGNLTVDGKTLTLEDRRERNEETDRLYRRR